MYGDGVPTGGAPLLFDAAPALRRHVWQCYPTVGNKIRVALLVVPAAHYLG